MLREAGTKDISLLNKIGEQVKPNFKDLFALDTEINNENAIILVYEESKKILGFLYALDLIDNIDLLYIIVDKDAQNKQIGTKLMQYFITNYQKDKTITLEVSVDNTIALKLYQKFDFKEVNRRKGYYHGIDAYLLRRDKE